MFKICGGSGQIKSSMKRGVRPEVQPLAKELLTLDSCWEGETILFNSVAPSGFTTLQ